VPENAGWCRKTRVVSIIVLVVTATFLWFSPKAAAATATSYSVEAMVPPPPRQLQQGDNVTIWVNLMAGDANTTYLVDLNVTDPADAISTASRSLTTNATGYGNASVVYPTDFSARAHTEYTGTYQISASFNETLGTVNGDFFVGLTNKTEYKRFEVVNIRAINYSAQEQVWVNVTKAGKVVFSEEKNPTAGGVVEASWRIPGNAAIGNYTVTVANSTASGRVKSVPDVQTLKVVRALSSLGVRVVNSSSPPQPLAGITVDVYNVTWDSSKTTRANGSVDFSLDVGNYTVKSLVYNLLFNTTSVDVPSAFQPNLTIVCPTYTLLVQVLDSKSNPSNGVTVSAYEWTSGVAQPAQSGTTDADGNATLPLTFGRYCLRVYKDSALLNETTIDLTKDNTFSAIRCSIYNVDLSVYVTDFFRHPIPNAVVKVERKTDGNYVETYSGTTRTDGSVVFDGIIGGNARIMVYINGKLSQTRYLYLDGPGEVDFKIDGYVAVGGFALEASQFFTLTVVLIIIALFLTIWKYKSVLGFFARRKKTP